MGRCLSGSSSPDGAVSERGSDIMSEVRCVQAYIHIHTVVFAADITISPCASGIDSEGHAANFVETEQIVQYSNARASFVQVGRKYCWPLLQEYLFWPLRIHLRDLICALSLTSYTDSRLHALFLVSKTQPEVQAQATDKHWHQSRKTLMLLQQLFFYFNYQKIKNICLSIRLSIYPSVCPSVCPSVYLSIGLSFYLSFYHSINLSFYLSILADGWIQEAFWVAGSHLWQTSHSKFGEYNLLIHLQKIVVDCDWSNSWR